MDERSVKSNIKAARKQVKMTQQQMADYLGVSRVAYSNLETGDTRIFNENVERIAEAAHISTEELVLGYAPRQDDPAMLEEYQETYRTAVNDYEERLSAKEREIAQLQEYIATLKDAVATKDDIIDLLKKYR